MCVPEYPFLCDKVSVFFASATDVCAHRTSTHSPHTCCAHTNGVRGSCDQKTKQVGGSVCFTLMVVAGTYVVITVLRFACVVRTCHLKCVLCAPISMGPSPTDGRGRARVRVTHKLLPTCYSPIPPQLTTKCAHAHRTKRRRNFARNLVWLLYANKTARAREAQCARVRSHTHPLFLTCTPKSAPIHFLCMHWSSRVWPPQTRLNSRSA